MTTLAHVSDLHFGAHDPRVADCLVDELHAHAPQAVIVSGDLTQRARSAQFAAARDYLQRLPGPRLVVPGNHDIPLYDVLRRFLAPLRRYRRFISRELCPSLSLPGVRIVGINTARSLTWKNGRISVRQIDELRAKLTDERDVLRVVVTHHPFIPPAGPDTDRIELVGRAARALEVLDERRVDLLLAGHLHHGYSGVTQPYYPNARRAIVSAQAGTAISRRVRGQANAYNWITFEHDRIAIEVRAWRDGRFVSAPAITYSRRNGSWERRV